MLIALIFLRILTLLFQFIDLSLFEAGITDSGAINLVADAIASGLSESLVKMDAQAVFNGESGH